VAVQRVQVPVHASAIDEGIVFAQDPRQQIRNAIQFWSSKTSGRLSLVWDDKLFAAPPCDHIGNPNGCSPSTDLSEISAINIAEVRRRFLQPDGSVILFTRFITGAGGIIPGNANGVTLTTSGSFINLSIISGAEAKGNV